MTDQSSKYTIIEPASPGNAVAIGVLLGGLAAVALLMLLFAPLDTKGHVSTLNKSPAYFAPR